jgi:hypothetical protein
MLDPVFPHLNPVVFCYQSGLHKNRIIPIAHSSINKQELHIGTLPINMIIMQIPNIITADERFSDIMRAQTIPTGSRKTLVTSRKSVSSF